MLKSANEQRCFKDGASISPERRGAVEAACRSWINRLIDPSRRNNLLFFRHLNEGTLVLSSHIEPIHGTTEMIVVTLMSGEERPAA